MKKAILSLAILMSLSLIFTISCGSSKQPPSGELPIWNIGDTWTEKSTILGNDIMVVYTVTGEQIHNGIACYNVTSQLTTMGSTSTSIIFYDKTTLTAIGEIKYPLSETGPTWVRNVFCSYSVEPYPLSVGKTWTVTCNATNTFLIPDGNETITETFNGTHKVESIESITVPAGTFQCFKISEYDSNDSVIKTDWITDVTKGIPVKSNACIPTDFMNSICATIELVSYSLVE